MAAFNVLAASVNAFLSFSIFSDQQDEAATIMKEILEEMDADKDKPGYFPCENFTEAMLFIWLQLIASFVTDAVLESLWKMLKDEQFCLQQIPSLQKMKEWLKLFGKKSQTLPTLALQEKKIGWRHHALSTTRRHNRISFWPSRVWERGFDQTTY